MTQQRPDSEVLDEASKMLVALDILEIEKSINVLENQTWKSVAKLDTVGILWSVEWMEEMNNKYNKQQMQELLKERRQLYLDNNS